MANKTAVDWLNNELNERCDIIGNENSIIDIFNKAKEMEKQQIIDFAYEIADELAYDVYSKKVIEDIFNKTFKSE
jgi:hypothetical protein